MDSTSEQDVAASAEPIAARRIGSPVTARLVAGGVLACCIAVLAVAVWLEPDPRGYGTHEQLGSAPCGMLLYTGLPCATCGMTTAFAHTVRGQWIQAIWAQPAGFVLALATIASAVICAWVLIRGRWPEFNWWRISPFRVFATLLVLLIGGWALKIAFGLADGTLPYRGG